MSIEVEFESPPRIWRLTYSYDDGYFVDGPTLLVPTDVIEKSFHDNSVKSALKLMRELESKLIATEKELARVEDKLQDAIWASMGENL